MAGFLLGFGVEGFGGLEYLLMTGCILSFRV